MYEMDQSSHASLLKNLSHAPNHSQTVTHWNCKSKKLSGPMPKTSKWVMMQFVLSYLLAVFSTFVWLHPRNQYIELEASGGRDQITILWTDIQLDNNIFATLRLGEKYKKGSRKDAKTQRKEGNRKIMDFVSMKQSPGNPVHPVKILFFQNNYSTRPCNSGIMQDHPIKLIKVAA